MGVLAPVRGDVEVESAADDDQSTEIGHDQVAQKPGDSDKQDTGSDRKKENSLETARRKIGVSRKQMLVLLGSKSARSILYQDDERIDEVFKREARRLLSMHGEWLSEMRSRLPRELDDELVPIDVAQALGIQEMYLYQLRNRGQFMPTRVTGRRYYYSVRRVHEFLDHHGEFGKYVSPLRQSLLVYLKRRKVA